MANELVAFKGSNLAKIDIGTLKQGLTQAQDTIQVGSGVQFLKMVKQDGEWVYGQADTEIEPDSRWAVNPLSLQTGYIAWGGGGKPLGKQMRSIFQPRLSMGELPNVGADWDENIAFQLQCISGEDVGVVVEYTQNSYGGKAAFAEIVQAVRIQLDKDPGKIVPVVVMKSTSYKHTSYGVIFNPVFKIVDWVAMDGTAAAEPAAEEQPAKVETVQQTAAQPAGRTRRFAAAGQNAETVTTVSAETVRAAGEAAAASPPPAANAPAGAAVRRRRRQ